MSEPAPWPGPPESDPDYLELVAATLRAVREEIAAMRAASATGKLLDEAEQHARDLQALLDEGIRR